MDRGVGGWIELYPIFFWIFGIFLTLQSPLPGMISPGFLLPTLPCLGRTLRSQRNTSYQQQTDLQPWSGICRMWGQLLVRHIHHNGPYRIVIILTRVHSVHWEGFKSHCMVFLNFVMVLCISILRTVSKSTFSKCSFGRERGVTKMSTLCTLLIMLTILDDP